jgi:hypothetical protein
MVKNHPGYWRRRQSNDPSSWMPGKLQEYFSGQEASFELWVRIFLEKQRRPDGLSRFI